MSPAFLIAGATGNSGTGVVETLSNLLTSSPDFASHRILALTRSRQSATAQRLAQLPHVQVLEHNWVDITADWLREHHVERAFLAPHSQPNQFAEESAFHLAALRAGVGYVVRISTTAANVRPDCSAFYPRSHWAIETMLETPEFSALSWTSLQPNIWMSAVLGFAVGYVKQYRQTGKLDKFATVLSADAPVALVDAAEVGAFAAHLLVQPDVSRHNRRKYVINGPHDVNGRMVVGLVEEAIGKKMEEVGYEDVSFVDMLAAHSPNESRSVISSIRYALDTAHAGKCTAATTSKEVLEIAPPRVTVEDVWKRLLAE